MYLRKHRKLGATSRVAAPPWSLVAAIALNAHRQVWSPADAEGNMPSGIGMWTWMRMRLGVRRCWMRALFGFCWHILWRSASSQIATTGCHGADLINMQRSRSSACCGLRACRLPLGWQRFWNSLEPPNERSWKLNNFSFGAAETHFWACL